MASLAHTNKHLSSAAKRQEAVRLTIATSSAIEGIHAPFKAIKPATGKASDNASKTSKAVPLRHRPKSG